MATKAKTMSTRTQPQTKWRDLVPGAFGVADVIFGKNPADGKRAKAAIKAAKAAGATFEDFEKEVVWHSYKNFKAPGLQQKHIEEQVERARKFWK
jgi:hypothetical protein